MDAVPGELTVSPTDTQREVPPANPGVTIASRYTGLTIPFGHHPLRSLLRLPHPLHGICTALTQLSYSYYHCYARHYGHSLDSSYVSPSYIRTLARYIRTL